MPVLRCFGGVVGACVRGSFSRLKRQIPFILGEPEFLYLITNIIELEGNLMGESNARAFQCNSIKGGSWPG